MSVGTVKNSLQVMIGKSISATGASVQLTSPTAANYIAQNEIVVLNSRGTYLTPGSTVADSEFIRLAFRTGNEIVLSNKVFGKKVFKFSGVDGSQGQEQVYTIGYTGSGTGQIDTTVSNDFYLHVTYTFDTQNWSQQQNRRTYFSTFDSPTARKVALDIAGQVNIDPGTQVKAEVLNSSTTTSSITGTASLVKNSKYITMSSSSHGIAAGDLVRLGCTGSGVGVLIPVYEVYAVNGTQVVLTSPYVGPSNSALTNSDMTILTAGTYFGIRLTAMPLTYRRDIFRFMRATFKVGMSGLGSTPLTKTQEVSMGNGDGRVVSELESFAFGYEGVLDRMSEIRLPVRADAVNTATTAVQTTTGGDVTTADAVYDCISIMFFNEATATATAPVRSSEEIRLYFVDGASQETGVIAQLSPWMESVGLSTITL